MTGAHLIDVYLPGVVYQELSWEKVVSDQWQRSPQDLLFHMQVMSCYKIFGYPTGLGALLMRKDATAILERNYFGGGTVEACSAVSDFVR